MTSNQREPLPDASTRFYAMVPPPATFMRCAPSGISGVQCSATSREGRACGQRMAYLGATAARVERGALLNERDAFPAGARPICIPHQRVSQPRRKREIAMFTLFLGGGIGVKTITPWHDAHPAMVPCVGARSSPLAEGRQRTGILQLLTTCNAPPNEGQPVGNPCNREETTCTNCHSP